MNKRVLAIVIVLFLIGAVAGYMMWNKPRRDMATEKGIEVSAAQLVQDYQANETTANTTYLNKAVEVSGTVKEIAKTQDGKTTILLSSGDAFTNVYCTMKEAVENITAGTLVTIRGKCNGMLSDVRLNEAVVVSK